MITAAANVAGLKADTGGTICGLVTMVAASATAALNEIEFVMKGVLSFSSGLTIFQGSIAALAT